MCVVLATSMLDDDALFIFRPNEPDEKNSAAARYFDTFDPDISLNRNISVTDRNKEWNACKQRFIDLQRLVLLMLEYRLHRTPKQLHEEVCTIMHETEDREQLLECMNQHWKVWGTTVPTDGEFEQKIRAPKRRSTDTPWPTKNPSP